MRLGRQLSQRQAVSASTSHDLWSRSLKTLFSTKRECFSRHPADCVSSLFPCPALTRKLPSAAAARRFRIILATLVSVGTPPPSVPALTRAKDTGQLFPPPPLNASQQGPASFPPTLPSQAQQRRQSQQLPLLLSVSPRAR